MSRKTLIVEIILSFATGIGKLIFMDWLNWKFPFIVVMILVWTYYILTVKKNSPEIFKSWGFRWDNFNKVLRLMLPFGLLAVIASLATGYFLNTINITWHIIPILILYPLWGVIQQYIVISLVTGNLFEMKVNKWTAIFAAASLFGIVHYPYWWLVLGTFILALFYGYTFLKERNVYVMGLFHGWLGAIFFYTVVGRDPFMEVMGMYF